MKKLISSLILGLMLTSCSTSEPVTTETGLIIEDIKIGEGDMAKEGDTLEVHYTGTFEDGTVFDSSKPRGQTFKFPLGAGYVIAGWDQGMQGMKTGGVRKLTIPGDLAYGAQGVPEANIGPNATLIFEIELISID